MILTGLMFDCFVVLTESLILPLRFLSAFFLLLEQVKIVVILLHWGKSRKDLFLIPNFLQWHYKIVRQVGMVVTNLQNCYELHFNRTHSEFINKYIKTASYWTIISWIIRHTLNLFACVVIECADAVKRIAWHTSVAVAETVGDWMLQLGLR